MIGMQDIHRLFDEFILECEYAQKLRPETVRGYKAVFTLFLKVMPEVTEINLLTPEMLNEFFKRIVLTSCYPMNQCSPLMTT